MTNTPMTSREAQLLQFINKEPVMQSLLYDINLMPEQLLSLNLKDKKEWGYMLDVANHFEVFKTQCEQQNQAVIAELKRQIAAKDSLIDSYREMEADCTKQAQTIANLNAKLEWWRKLFPSITPKAAIEYQSVYDKADKAEETIAELVKALEEIKLKTYEPKALVVLHAMNKINEIATKAIAKVKGK